MKALTNHTLKFALKKIYFLFYLTLILIFFIFYFKRKLLPEQPINTEETLALVKNDWNYLRDSDDNAKEPTSQ